jgi:TonB-linked SusC/RagA family outer membrane protein
VSAAGHTQNVSLSVKDQPIQKVFAELKKQTGYSFIWDEADLKGTDHVTIRVQNATLTFVLDAILKDQPLSYKVIGNLVVLKPKAIVGFESTVANDLPPLIDVSGRIVNEVGELVPASIMVKGTRIGTMTDENGYFKISAIYESSMLVISAINIETKEIRIGGKKDLGVITVKMKITALGEVVINKGYYTEQQKVSVSNVSHIDAKVIEKQPVNNVLLALQGRVPGLFITQSTGVSGSGVTVQIEGKNSIVKGNQPLYVIDGVPYPSQLLGSINSVLGSSANIPGPINGVTGTGPGNPLSFINPADIESIDVLKDADATAIYGSRAANGAILITTKRGKSGKTLVNVNIQNGWGKVTRKMDMLNTPQYLELRRDGLKNDNIDVNSAPYNTPLYRTFYLADLYFYDSTRYTDWQDELIGGTARYTDIQASISGGNELTQVLFSTTYHKETSVFPLDFADQKGSMHINLNHRSANRKFNTQFSGMYVVNDNKLPYSDFTSAALNLAPNAPALYTENGRLNWQPVLSGTTLVSTWDNPLAKSGQEFNINTHNAIFSAVIGYDVLPGLNIRTSFGYNRLESDEFQSQPIEYNRPEDRPTATRTSVFGRNLISSWQIEPMASYQAKIGSGKLEALIGGTMQRNERERSQIRGRGFSSDQVMKDMKSAATIDIQSTFAAIYKFNSLFGRLNYNLKDRYIVNLTARRDGSTRFGSENLFHTFGSVAGGWIFSNENFTARHLPFISFGKLRASYGR